MAHSLMWIVGVFAVVIARGHRSMRKGAEVVLAALIPFGGLWSHRMLARAIARREGK